jgi:phosphoglycerate kinase
MSEIRSIKDAAVQGKRVIVRVVLNVPLKDGMVTDDRRLRAILPTIALLREKGAAAITLMGYVGRPNGKVVEELRVAPVVARLGELVDMTGITVLENLRFDPREEANDESLARELAAHGDLYVNDAFADSHRAYASTVGITKLLPSYAGLLLEEEVRRVSAALTPPQGAIAIIGGAKFETKIPLIEKLLSVYTEVLLGGALANNVIKARGLPFGSSLVSEAPVPPEIAMDERLIVPSDAIFLQVGSNAERSGLVVDIRTTEKVIDIGPVTAKSWADKVSQAPFVLWNGPLGIYEKGYSDGTDAVAAALVQGSAQALVGGGDTAAAIEKQAFDPSRVFVSTGGGAMLQFLADGTLPGIEALKSAPAQV